MAATKKKPAKRRVAKPAPKVAPPAQSDPIRIEYVPLGSVEPAEINPKKHVIEKIQDSIRRFGFVLPLTENASTGRLVAGHGRLEALLGMKDAGDETPARIQKDAESGEWLVPVLRGVAFENEEEASAFCLADNRLSEIGGWDDTALAEILRGMPEAPRIVAGFSTAEVDALIATIEGRSTKASNVDPNEEWGGMPSFGNEDLDGFRRLIVHFKDQAAVDAFAELIGHKLTDKTKFVWYPEEEHAKFMHKRYVSES